MSDVVARVLWERFVERAEVLRVHHGSRVGVGLAESTAVRSEASQWIYPGSEVGLLRRGILVSVG